LTKFRLANDTLSSRLEELRSQHDQTTGHLAALKQEHMQATKRLEGELGDSQRQVETLKSWQRRAQSLTIDLEEQKRIVATLRDGKDNDEGEKEGNEVLKQEFRRELRILGSLEFAEF
jgi:mitotic spindle assembly checkpoint protein MAD1